MLFFFIIFNLLFQIEEPVIGKINYPETETKAGIDKRIVADLKVKMEIDENGIINKFEYMESKNIEKERIEEFFNFFKKQLLGKKIKPMLKDGKPIACTYIYTFSWILYYAPPEVHFVSSKEREKIDYLKDLRNNLIRAEEYENKLQEKAKEILKSYNLFEKKIDNITYFYTYGNIEKEHTKLKNFIDFFKDTFSNFLDEDLNLEQKVFFFPTKEKLVKFLKEEKFPNWADGLYIGPLNSIFTIFPYSKKYLDVFLHEEAHFLINKFIFNNINYPLFLREGFAEWTLHNYENNNNLITVGDRWWEYKKILKKEKEKAVLSYLIFWDFNEEKSESEIKKFYAFSWAFLEFISKDKNFEKFIFDLKEKGFSKEIFEENFGNWEEIQREFLLYLKEKF